MAKVLSPEWMEQYAEEWNATPATRDGTKKLSMVIEYRLAEDDSRAGQFEVAEGKVVRAGSPVEGVKPDYRGTAATEIWKKLGDLELDPSRAILSRKVKFKGPLNVALAHLGALEEAMRMFGRIDGTDW
jgi:putative sterol carrier protein